MTSITKSLKIFTFGCFADSYDYLVEEVLGDGGGEAARAGLI